MSERRFAGTERAVKNEIAVPIRQQNRENISGNQNQIIAFFMLIFLLCMVVSAPSQQWSGKDV